MEIRTFGRHSYGPSDRARRHRVLVVAGRLPASADSASWASPIGLAHADEPHHRYSDRADDGDGVQVPP